MKRIVRSLQAAGLAISCLLLTQCATGLTVSTASASTIASESRAALRDLYRQNPQARELGTHAKGILVFPRIAKGGFVVGGMGGNGALFGPDGSIRDYYQTGGLSYGLQAGVQKYSYALFLMDNEALANINRADGWEIGGGPNFVVVDKGVAASLSTITLNEGTYAFFFNQAGLMASMSLQGSKITRIHPGR